MFPSVQKGQHYLESLNYFSTWSAIIIDCVIASSCLCILYIFKYYLHNVLKRMITWHNYFNSIQKSTFPNPPHPGNCQRKIHFNCRTLYHKKEMCTCKSLSLSVSLASLLTLAPLPQNVANRRKGASVGHQERWVRKWWWYSSTHSHTQLRCGYVTCSHSYIPNILQTWNMKTEHVLYFSATRLFP